MQTSSLKQIDDAIRQTIDWQGFTLDSIDVSPDTYIAICDYYFSANHGMSWMPERYKGNKINIVHDLRTPFHLKVSPATTTYSGDLSVSFDLGASFQHLGKATGYRPPLIIIDDLIPE